MADLKISQLTVATTPLAGTEVLPIVQSSSTKKVATDNLTVKNIRSNATTGILQIAGPAAAATRTMTVPDANFTAARIDAANSFTADQTLATGNLIQGTAAKGVNFTANTPTAGMTSQLLNWYEEGTWTPNLVSTGATFGYSAQQGKYTRIGRQVFITADIYMNAGAGGTLTNTLTIETLPFAADTAASSFTSFNMGYMDYVDVPAGHLGVNMYVANGGTTINLGSFIDNAAPSIWTAAVLTNRCRLMFTGIYNTL